MFKTALFTFGLLLSTLANAYDPILCTEIGTDPLPRGYITMTDAEIAVSLNTEDRIRIRDSMTGTEIFQAVDATEFLALAAADRDLIMQFFTWDSINPAGNEATIFATLFGAGSATLDALILARQELISRAVEIGVASIPVKEAHVAECP